MASQDPTSSHNTNDSSSAAPNSSLLRGVDNDSFVMSPSTPLRRQSVHQLQPTIGPTKHDSTTLPLAILALAASLGMFSFGYEIVVINAPGPVVEQWINMSYARRGSAVDTSQSTAGLAVTTVRFLYSLAAAVFAAGGMLGALSAGPLAEHIGRRGSQLVSAALGLVATPLMALSVYVWSPELFIVGRFMVGITNDNAQQQQKHNTGAATVLSAMYIIESSPRSIRGSIANINNFACVIGVITAQVLGLPILFGTYSLWPLLFVVATAAPALQILLLIISPETPRYLYLTRNQHERATKALQRLRNRSDVYEELLELEHEARGQQQQQQQTSSKVTVKQLFTQRRYLWPLGVAIVLHFSQVFSGSNGVLGYSSILFQQAGLSPDSASYANLAIGAILLLMAFVTISLIDRLGRKILHMVGMGGMIVFGLLITLFSALPHHVQDASANAGFNIANIISVYGFTAFYALGPGALPWIIMTELFSQSARGPASSIASLVNWAGQFITFLIFPTMQIGLGVYVYLPFVGAMVVFFVFLLKYLPETKARTFEQISAIFERY